jgi:hypothetical protein
VIPHGAAKEREELLPGPRVQVPRRLVRVHDLGPADQRAGARDPLLLTAGELVRSVREPVAESDRVDHGVEPPGGGVVTRDVERQGDVLGSGQGRDQVERLEDEPDLLPAEQGELFLRERRQIDVADEHPSAGRRIQARHAVKEGRLTRSGRPHDRAEAAPLELDGHAVQRSDGGVALAIDLREIDRAGGRGGGRRDRRRLGGCGHPSPPWRPSHATERCGKRRRRECERFRLTL